MIWSQRRIHAAAAMNNAQSYLEIGVHKGETFLTIDIPTKDAVDPNFLFDTAAHTTETVRFHAMTSDAFWRTAPARRYDVIMIDGLHTFEQTFRDLLASLRFSHERTVWLIDDTIPVDVFSAMRDQGACYRARKSVGLNSWQWHGDVFKVVAALHDFLPTLSYATIEGSGNPQTLAWVEPRADFTPRFDNLEAISRLEYFDIDGIRDVFFPCTEDAALDRLKTALSRAA